MHHAAAQRGLGRDFPFTELSIIILLHEASRSKGELPIRAIPASGVPCGWNAPVRAPKSPFWCGRPAFPDPTRSWAFWVQCLHGHAIPNPTRARVQGFLLAQTIANPTPPQVGRGGDMHGDPADVGRKPALDREAEQPFNLRAVGQW